MHFCGFEAIIEVRKAVFALLKGEIMNPFLEELFSLADSDYRDFQAKLTPTISREDVIGVRTPELKKLAKRLYSHPYARQFLAQLPHRYYDENQLHARIICNEKDFEKCLCLVEKFLPYIDNWATCDGLSPKVFGKNREKLLPHIRRWINSPHTYTRRFAVGMLMSHFLDDRFSPEYLEMVAGVESEEYYVNMMCAWYFATALAKQYDRALPFITENRLPLWVHNKTIQKAVESFRITPEQKTLLRSYKIK